MRVVERTHYYAKPGLAAEVLEQRRKACAVRVAIGLPAGEIFVKHPSGDGSEPDVAWQCAFADATAHAADLAARAASKDFENVRLRMRTLYARFERQVFTIASL
jgi:tRNA(Arg) A34 adenosine deaminase TadA